jgi:hypothetical protein
MTAAHRGGTYSCGKLGSTWTAGPIEGDIAGRSYAMDVRVSGYKGPGTYGKGGELTPGSGVASVFVQITPKGEDLYSMTKPGGTIVINADERSGTMDVQLGGKSGSTALKGSWTCPPDF